jgi:GDPmannose 4,6-dehydratase
VDLRPGAALSDLRAIVTGAGGQDGSYLVELLAERGYEVVGLDRGDVDLLDLGAVRAMLREAAPREVYNLASPSFVPRSWNEPVEVAQLGAVGVTILLEAIRDVDPAIRFFQASSADVFGIPGETPQSEQTPFRPTSPYGIAKAYGTFTTAAYRSKYGLHASSAILFNHESPRRSTEFLPAKVAHGVAAIAAGLEEELVLGDLSARRDWGYAPDFVEAMWLMLQQDAADDYVIATGEPHSVRELVELAFRHAGLDWQKHVRIDESLVRTQNYEHDGTAANARERLGWTPTVTFEQLVALLVDAARAA